MVLFSHRAAILALCIMASIVTLHGTVSRQEFDRLQEQVQKNSLAIQMLKKQKKEMGESGTSVYHDKVHAHNKRWEVLTDSGKGLATLIGGGITAHYTSQICELHNLNLGSVPTLIIMTPTILATLYYATCAVRHATMPDPSETETN